MDRILLSFYPVFDGVSSRRLTFILSKLEAGDMCFWERMKAHADGDNTLGNLTMLYKLSHTQLDSKVDGYRPKLIYAREATGCYTFTKVDSPPDDAVEGSVQSVIWLPWLDGHVTAAHRYRYERLNTVDYFMTTQLSGCRFTVTDDVVLHIANKPARREGRTPGDRTNAEANALKKMGSTGRSRRLSMSPISGDTDTDTDTDADGYSFSYAGTSRAYVFGYRQGVRWTYRALVQGGAGAKDGKWITLC
ncbi:hypothetical protein [Microbulbifer sp. TRSA007]|uniref:hypothetical protein n=1 Tax=Microbulbifer sp. TRSA007 TaxID=3243384 RepID=UPI00403A4906